jgi:hypothetical protein
MAIMVMNGLVGWVNTHWKKIPNFGDDFPNPI